METELSNADQKLSTLIEFSDLLNERQQNKVGNFSETYPFTCFKGGIRRLESREISEVPKGSKVLKGRLTEEGSIPFLIEFKTPAASK